MLLAPALLRRLLGVGRLGPLVLVYADGCSAPGAVRAVRAIGVIRLARAVGSSAPFAPSPCGSVCGCSSSTAGCSLTGASSTAGSPSGSIGCGASSSGGASTAVPARAPLPGPFVRLVAPARRPARAGRVGRGRAA